MIFLFFSPHNSSANPNFLQFNEQFPMQHWVKRFPGNWVVSHSLKNENNFSGYSDMIYFCHFISIFVSLFAYIQHVFWNFTYSWSQTCGWWDFSSFFLLKLDPMLAFSRKSFHLQQTHSKSLLADLQFFEPVFFFPGCVSAASWLSHINLFRFWHPPQMWLIPFPFTYSH